MSLFRRGAPVPDEYNVPVRMSVEIFLEGRDREEASGKFLCRFGYPRQDWIVLQGKTDETGGERRSDYILNGVPKRIDIDRRVQM